MYVMDIFGDPQTNTKIETLIINSQGILNKMDVSVWAGIFLTASTPAANGDVIIN